MATFHGSRSASHIGRKPAFGQTCSMKTLLQDGILQVGEKVLTLEFEGERYYGDLRKDGTIMMRGPDDSPHIYATPVAWANHCCKMLNPESKPLNAWSSIRFRGKRLDSYKLKWYRAQKRGPNNSNNNIDNIDNDNINCINNNLNNNINNNLNNNNSSLEARAAINILEDMNLQNNTLGGVPLDNNIIRTLTGLAQQQQHRSLNNNSNNSNNHHQQQQQGSSRLMIHNPITNYFPQYENPIKNKKLIKSVLISNNMDNDCKRLVAKSLDLSVDPCLMSKQMNNAIQNSDEDVKNSTNGDLNDITDNNSNGNTNNDNNSLLNDSISTTCTTLKTTVINYEQLGIRPHNTHNPNTMVKCIPFSAVDRIQPFNVTVSTNALLLVDFHSHLVSSEVAGYLAGSWDPGQHILTVTQAFPCRTDLTCESTATTIEDEIKQDIEKRNLTLVGWYHSHQGKYSNHPTIKDIQNQMEHQISMKETSTGYSPCIGLICSPHDIRTDDDLSPSFQIYWIMPPPESMSNHYGRPMQMYYSVTRDLFLTQDLLLEMRLLATYYTRKASDMVDFKSLYQYNDRITNLDKLSGSIKPKLPKDLQESEYPDEPGIWKAAVDHFWKFLMNLVVPQAEPTNSEQPDDSQNQVLAVENADGEEQSQQPDQEDQLDSVDQLETEEPVLVEQEPPEENLIEQGEERIADEQEALADDDDVDDQLHMDEDIDNHSPSNEESQQDG